MSPLKRTFWLGAGLIVLSNAVALGGVYYNRSGEPDSVLQLSERELSLGYGTVIEGSEHAGKAVELQYRLAKGWVNPDKLRALGFELGEYGASYHRDRIARDGFVVLELDGAQYQAELAAAEADLKQAQVQIGAGTPDDAHARHAMELAEYELGRLRASNTRLYVVDAGLDGASLRQRYPQTTRYSVVRAGLRMGVQWTPGAPTERDYSLYTDLAEINVPRQWRAVFSEWKPYDRAARERSHVSVELAFGKRFEPWMVAAKKPE